jgi:hypothetical protein
VEADSDENVDDEDASASVEGPAKMGKKKAEKLQAKAERKLEREAMQREQEEKKKQREKDDEEARCKPGLPDVIFSNQKIPIWVNFGVSCNGCWYIICPFGLPT